MPDHGIAPDVAGDHQGKDQQSECPVEKAGGQIPNATGQQEGQPKAVLAPNGRPASKEFLEKYGKLVPDYIIEMIARRDQPFFTWETHLHYNYS